MADQFQPTRWSLLRQTLETNPQIQERAWGEVHLLYREPLEVFARQWGWSAEDAEDLVQSFFIKLAHRDWIREADPEKGKMRTFLLGRLKNHLLEARRSIGAQKRGGDVEVTDLELLEVDGAEFSEEAWIASFDREWARSIYQRSLGILEAEFKNKGKESIFAETMAALTGELSRPVAEIAAELDMTEGSLNVALHRMRMRFREIIRREVSDTLGPEDDLSEEIRHLAASL